MRRSHKMVLNSTSPNLNMPYMIGTTVHKLVEFAMIQLHTSDRLLKIIQIWCSFKCPCTKNRSSSSLYLESSYPQQQATYDLYEYGYDTSKASSSSSYYPMQPETSYELEFTTDIFKWAPLKPYYQPHDTSQKSSFNKRYEISYNPAYKPYEMSVEDYNAA